MSQSMDDGGGDRDGDMGMDMDFEALRRAMQENYEQPEGPARNARAEQLLAEAEKLNIPLAVIEALGHQLKVYNYSSRVRTGCSSPSRACCAHTTSAPRISTPRGRTRYCTGSSIDILPARRRRIPALAG